MGAADERLLLTKCMRLLSVSYVVTENQENYQAYIFPI